MFAWALHVSRLCGSWGGLRSLGAAQPGGRSAHDACEWVPAVRPGAGGARALAAPFVAGGHQVACVPFRSSPCHAPQCKHLVAVMLAETCGAANVKVLDDAALVLRKTALLHAVLPAAPLIPPTATAGRADGFSAASRGIDTPASLGDSGPWPAGVSQLPDR